MNEDSSQPVFHIGSVAAIASVHPQMLRLYERQGLLKPSRSLGRTRLYSEQDVERVKLIVHLTRNEGVNLAGVAKILELDDNIREVESVIRRWMQEWSARVERELATRHESLEAARHPPARAITVPIRRG
ncbi:MAG: MerR family transcriptional regulator [Nitrospirota bacterium]